MADFKAEIKDAGLKELMVMKDLLVKLIEDIKTREEPKEDTWNLADEIPSMYKENIKTFIQKVKEDIDNTDENVKVILDNRAGEL